jgi:hypothetical protein
MIVRGRATITGCVVAGLVLTACTGSHTNNAASATPGSSSAPVATTSAPATSGSAPGTVKPGSSAGTSVHPTASAVSLPPSVSNVVAKRKSVALTGCASAGAGWKASGTATNSGSTAADYAITVFFTDEHATVESFAATTVAVAPGKTEHWEASKNFAASKKTLCVLRGVG